MHGEVVIAMLQQVVGCKNRNIKAEMLETSAELIGVDSAGVCGVTSSHVAAIPGAEESCA